MRDPTREQLQSMRPGDRVLLRPGATKADFDGSAFGDKDVPLAIRGGDGLCAAAAIVAMEIAMPVHGRDRKRTPAFTVTSDGAPLTRGDADRMFAGIAAAALPANVAATLSLHSGRVFLAVALRANGEDIPTVQACCRWKTAASAAIYSRLTLDEHERLITAALRAEVTPTLSASLRRGLTIDDDERIAELRRSLGAVDDESSAERAAQPQQRPRAAAPSTTADSSTDSDSDAGAPVTPGPRLDSAAVVRGSRVAVPFATRKHGEAHFPGVVVRVSAARARVRFDNGTRFDVERRQLFSVAGDAGDPTR